MYTYDVPKMNICRELPLATATKKSGMQTKVPKRQPQRKSQEPPSQSFMR